MTIKKRKPRNHEGDHEDHETAWLAPKDFVSIFVSFVSCFVPFVSCFVPFVASFVSFVSQMWARSGSCIRLTWTSDISTTSEVTGARRNASTPTASAIAFITAP